MSLFQYTVSTIAIKSCDFILLIKYLSFPAGSVLKNHLSKQEPQEMQIRSLGQEDPLEEKMATHSSILAWEIAWTEEPGGLQSMGWQRVGCD